MAKKIERENSFAVKQPELLKLWDFDKNALDPYKISDGSQQRAWFICPECGESYTRAVRDITSAINKTCLACRPKFFLKTGISFAKKHPELLNEWDYEKNSEDPYKIAYSSHKKIFWKCSNNHSYITTPNRKSSSREGCPYCRNQKVLSGFNDLLSQDPILATEWDYDKNELTPEQITRHSGKKVWWICQECGNSYLCSPNNRVIGRSCPNCRIKPPMVKKPKRPFLSLMSESPDLVKEWDYEKNELTPDKISRRSSKKVWWICPHCKKSYLSSPDSRQKGSACPHCCRSCTSFAEQFILSSLRAVFGEENVLSRDRSTIGMELDIYIPSLKFAIEPGGYKWHSEENKIQLDKTKRVLCEANGITLLTIIYNSPYESRNNLSWNIKEELLYVDREKLLSLAYEVFSFLGIEHIFSPDEFNELVKISFLNSRRTTTDEFINRLSKVNSSILVLGDFLSHHEKIEVSCKNCGKIWKSKPYALLQGHGCPECSKRTQPVLCIDTGESFISVTEACKKIKRDTSSLTKAIKKNGTCAGYKWKYITKEEYNELHRK